VNRVRKQANTERPRYHVEKVIPPLETPRLFLRPLEIADAQQAQLLFPHWEIVRYLSNVVPWPYPPDGAHTYYRDFAIPAMERGDEWHWTIRLKTKPERLIGSIALMKRKRSIVDFGLACLGKGKAS